MRLRLPVAAVGALLLAGCLLQNAAAEKRLRDSVRRLNDDLRWSRVALAVQRVDPDFRKEFVEHHRHWGQRIRIADSELVAVRMADDREGAMSIVTFRWYSRANMTLHQTTVHQQWKHLDGGDGYVLVDEQVQQGDERLLGWAKDDEDEEGSDRASGGDEGKGKRGDQPEGQASRGHG